MIAGVERLLLFHDRGFGTTSANFCVPEKYVKERYERIAWAQPNHLLRVGLGLLEAPQG
jgi:hypothetical protein